MTVNLGPFVGVRGTAIPGNENFIKIVNNPSFDSYTVRVPLDGSSVGSFDPIFFRITLTDPSGMVFSNDLLPTTPPSLNSFATDRFRIVFEDGSGVARVSGSLTSLVPLPTAVILFGAGLIALVGLGAGSWRKRNNSLA